MDENSYPAICAKVNQAFDARQFLSFLNYKPEMARRNGDVWLAMCPIHKETVFRTLVINPRNNTYHCENHSCPANKPGDFIDLYCKARNLTIPESIRELVNHFGAEYFGLTPKQLSVIDDLVQQVRREPASL